MKKYNWFDLYTELANGLKKFYMNNLNEDKRVGELFYDRCLLEDDFFETFNWAKNITEKSLDPFHIFVSFNNTRTSLEKKQKRILFFLKILDIDIDIQQYSIDNRLIVPHILILKVVANRSVIVQDEIWDFFIAVTSNDQKGIEQGFLSYEHWYGMTPVL